MIAFISFILKINFLLCIISINFAIYNNFNQNNKMKFSTMYRDINIQ